MACFSRHIHPDTWSCFWRKAAPSVGNLFGGRIFTIAFLYLSFKLWDDYIPDLFLIFEFPAIFSAIAKIAVFDLFIR